MHVLGITFVQYLWRPEEDRCWIPWHWSCLVDCELLILGTNLRFSARTASASPWAIPPASLSSLHFLISSAALPSHEGGDWVRPAECLSSVVWYLEMCLTHPKHIRPTIIHWVNSFNSLEANWKMLCCWKRCLSIHDFRSTAICLSLHQCLICLCFLVLNTFRLK